MLGQRITIDSSYFAELSTYGMDCGVPWISYALIRLLQKNPVYSAKE